MPPSGTAARTQLSQLPCCRSRCDCVPGKRECQLIAILKGSPTEHDPISEIWTSNQILTELFVVRTVRTQVMQFFDNCRILF